MKTSRGVLALTPGEPAGVGPDLAVWAARKDWPVEFVAIADPGLLRERAEQLKVSLALETFHASRAPTPHQAGTLKVLPVPLAERVQCGRLSTANAAYVLETLRTAVNGCLEGRFSALVTGPVHKGIINDAGIPFSGHTEFLAQLTHTPQVVMMLATEGLRVALVTTHLPLSQVSQAITRSRLEQVIHVLYADLRNRFGLSRPRILVCGLNPHAGEGGHLGREEIEVIEPVLASLRAQGMDLSGPLPADTMFVPRHLEQADAVLAMYHDQGLPILKHMGFGQAVNITLGLPFIRTSVDHGTALDLAGTGQVDTGSLETAILTAAHLATHV